MAGKLIVFEGIDGSGKSTQLALLAGWLREQGFSVLEVAEPGTTQLGQELRQLLLNKELHAQPLAECFMFLAARAQLVDEVLRPAIERGDVVLCDRYTLSTLAYQSYGRGIAAHEATVAACMLAVREVVPDLTICLDVSVDSRRRTAAAPDNIERRGASYFDRVRIGYLCEMRKLPTLGKVIETDDRSIEQVFEDVKAAAAEIL